MTAYVFVSNNISIRYLKEEPVDNYLNAFKIMLEQSLNTKSSLVIKKNRMFARRIICR